MSALINNVAVFQKQNCYKSFPNKINATEGTNYETLAVSVPKKYVYHVELNRPDNLNTFNNIMWKDLSKCFDSLSNNPECRVVVLSARGKLFTAGIDLSTMAEFAGEMIEHEDIARKTRLVEKRIITYQDGITSLEKCVKPVMVIVHNACIGAGVDLITAADMRYCTADSWFQVKEVDVGLAADVGTLQRLPKVVGNTSAVRELCFSGRKFDAKEAKELGLISKIFSDKAAALNEVLTKASVIASKSPVAVQMTKRSLNYSQSRTTEEGLRHIRLINSVMVQSEDLSKSAMAVMSKNDKTDFENF